MADLTNKGGVVASTPVDRDVVVPMDIVTDDLATDNMGNVLVGSRVFRQKNEPANPLTDDLWIDNV